jgi:soluble lytic murein transglycosylase-like protein
MDVLTTILSCSLYLADDDLVRAIAQSTSESDPDFVFDASIDRIEVDPSPIPKTPAEALARTQTIVARGGRPLLGLMQVPPAWLSAFGRDLVEAFNPCTNIAVGTAMLSQFDFECASEKTEAAQAPSKATPSKAEPQASGLHAPTAFSASVREPSAVRRRCVLRKYEEGIGQPEFATVTTLELHHQRPTVSTVSDAPIFLPAAQGRPGADSLLVPTGARNPSVFASSP